MMTPVQMNALPAAATPRFSGFHPDAVVGADVKAVGVTSYQDNTSSLYFTLKKNRALAKFTNRTQWPLTLKREKDNSYDKNAVGLYADVNGQSLKLGAIPATLTGRLAPLMDEGHEFSATLNRIQPFKLKNQWNHQLVFRLEYVTKPGRAPNQQVRDQVEQAFTDAREQEKEGWKKVLTVIPEAINTYSVDGQRLVERIDQERNEATYYVNGRTVTKVQLDPTQVVNPVYSRDNLSKPVTEKIQKLLNREV